MKVISFKVDDDIYNALKKMNVSFRSIFEPFAVQLAQNNGRGVKYTDGIRNNSGELIVYISQLNKVIEKITIKFGFDKKEVKK